MNDYYERLIKGIEEKGIDALIDIDTNRLYTWQVEELFRMAIGSLLEKYVEEVNYGKLNILDVAKELEKLEKYKEIFKDIFASNKNVEKIYHSFYLKIDDFLKSSIDNGFTGLVI